MYNYVSKEWLYTSITGAKDLNKIKFCKLEITRDISIEAGRPINEEDYVNVEWLMGQLKKQMR